jgi:hypothetical protein
VLAQHNERGTGVRALWRSTRESEDNFNHIAVGKNPLLGTVQHYLVIHRKIQH